MNKKIIILISTIVVIITAVVSVYFWRQSNAEKNQQADEAAVRSLIENFGHVLKNNLNYD